MLAVTVRRLGMHLHRNGSHRKISGCQSLRTASIHESLGFSVGSQADSQRWSRARGRRAVEPAARVANRGPAAADVVEEAEHVGAPPPLAGSPSPAPTVFERVMPVPWATQGYP
jgi:hypothetical protein